MNILVITLTNIGDVILTTPVITSLKRAYPSARLTLVVGQRAAELFEDEPGFDSVIRYDKRISLREKWSLVQRLRAKRFSLVVDLRSTLYPFLLGHWNGHLLALFKRSPGPHRVDRHLARLSGLGIRPSQEFYIPESVSARRRVDELFERKGILREDSIVALSPGARSELKRWTLEGYRKVARTLEARGYRILWVGDASDRDLVDRLMQDGGSGWVSICGETSLKELAVVLRRCRLVVTNDSAPMHLARAVGAKTVSIFGPTDEAKYAPRGEGHRVVREELFCAPCEKAQCRYKHECMKNLEPQRVIQAAEALLAS